MANRRRALKCLDLAVKLGYGPLAQDTEDRMATEQLGFEFDRIHEEERLSRLPSNMEEAIPYYRQLIDRHDAAMMDGDVDMSMAIREEACNLAANLNGGRFGILGNPDAPAFVLERSTAAPTGQIPRWGQRGDYVTRVGAMQVRITQEGIFGVGSLHNPWLGFAAHAVERDSPFISPSGYRSFVGAQAAPRSGIMPDELARLMIDECIRNELRGRLVPWSISTRGGTASESRHP